MKSSAESNDSPSDLHGHPEQDHELLLLEPIRAAEVLEFFDDLGVFSELEADPSANIAILRYRDAPVSVDHGYVTPSASAPQFQSFSAMLDSSEIPAFDEDTGALGPMESLLQLHVHEADFSALSIEAASDSLALKQELQYFTNSDRYDSEPSSFASEPATPPPAGEADTETDVALRPTKKTKKKKKSTSQRQKEELSYLRGKLFEYENELKRIAMENKDRVSSGANEANESNETQPNDVSGQTPATSEADAIAVRVKSLSLWETMAKNQLEEKNRAELENAALKRKMEAQLKFAKSLERMLRKRRIWDGLQEPTQQRFMTMSVKDSDAFESLTSSIEARTPIVDEEFAAQGLTAQSPPKRDTSIAFADEEGIRIDFVHATDVPFEAQAVSSVIWEYLQKRELKLNNMNLTTHLVEQTEDFLLTTQRMTSTYPSDTRNITVHSAFKRIHQEHRILFVWESLTESKASASRGTPAAVLISRGCGQILRREATSPQGGQESSILQSCVTVVPILGHDEQEEYEASDGSSPGHESKLECLDTGLLTELTLSAYKQNAQTVRQAIENALIDDLLAQ